MKLTKHIKRKYQKAVEDGENLDTSPGKGLDELVVDPEKLMTQELLKQHYNKSNIVALYTESEPTISIILNNSGNYLCMPIPDITLVYFNYAYVLNSQRIEQRKKLMPKLAPNVSFTENISGDLYNFYGVASTEIITLFTSIEAFINQLIPSNFKYDRIGAKCIETFDSQQIQRWLNFEEKLKKVVPLATTKNYYNKQSSQNQLITNLKELRDDLVHAKSDMTFVNQSDILKRLLKFKYEETLEAVADMFNFFTPGYVELCPCELTW